jgi:TolA-binding protein
VVLLFIDLNVFSQQTAIYLDPERQYQSALDLFAKQKYGAAQKEFRQVQLSRENISVMTRGNAAYYVAKCAAELFNKDAEYLLLSFLNQYPANGNYQAGLFDLGNYYYRLKKYKNAIEWFNRVDPSDLAVEKKDEINFKLGYCFYMTNDYDKAGKAFNAMKDGNTKYATAAQYYFAHIAYVNENYETALNSFLKLKDSEAFAPVAPYYITQIYYKQKKYDEVLKYAPSLLDTSSTRNGLEISRMVAESYYRMEKYKEALPYLIDYEKNSPAAGRSDDYAIAYSYYRTGDYEKAATYFQKVVTADDSLGQNAYFHLADAYLQLKNKKAARTAFQSAARTAFDPVIQEESQFNYAKLSYELSFQSVAIESFRDFLKKFPESTYAGQANEMLVDVYTSTHNYKDAIVALEGIKNKSENLKAAYQKALYYRGVELFMDNKPEEAIKLFANSLYYPQDQKLLAMANYWSGEAYYRLQNYEEAIRSYSEFQVTPAALRTPYYNLANYNIGYALFKKEEYGNSQMAFRKFLQERPVADANRFNDALLRIGDCFFMLKDQASAMDYYNQAISSNAKAGDYAIYQKAIILGVQGRMNDKVSTLEKLLSKYPKSVYYDDALFEAGQASLIAGNNEEALKFYRRIIADYPSSVFARKAELGEALVYYNTRQDERAMSSYKKIVQKYPNTVESREALAQIKNISVSQNKVDDYLTYAKNIPEADVSDDAEDSLSYEAAEMRYTQGNCATAIDDFSNYLRKFPNAIFRLSATYLKSDCLFRDKKYAEALPGYEYVISQPANNFTERALLNAGIINYNLKQYPAALNYFEKLEAVAKSKDNILAALSGQLRCNYRLKDCDKSIVVAAKINDSQVTDKDLLNEAHLIAGRCLVQKENLVEAKNELDQVAKRTNSEMTAESKYLLAYIEYRNGNYKESQKLILEIQKQVPSYDFWIAKGFILLGDNYLAQKDTFQAKETYKSIVENYEGDAADPDDLKSIAREKLTALTTLQEDRDARERKLRQEAAPKDSINIEN